MRYLIYESRGNQVPMSRQLDFLQNYIYLEKMRLDDYVQVDFTVTGKFLDTRADPLIFIAFIENAFKHGTKARSKNPFIRIRFTLEEPGRIEFMAENSTDADSGEKKSPGLGLTHVKNRLDLLYPENYILNIEHRDDIFRVTFTLFVQ
jgi:LytS/YehU family sensor histidine kinase